MTKDVLQDQTVAVKIRMGKFNLWAVIASDYKFLNAMAENT